MAGALALLPQQADVWMRIQKPGLGEGRGRATAGALRSEQQVPAGSGSEGTEVRTFHVEDMAVGGRGGGGQDPLQSHTCRLKRWAPRTLAPVFSETPSPPPGELQGP